MPAPPVDDYYALLEVDAGADAEALRRAWRRVVVRCHPDRAGAAATTTFQQLAAAYAVLSDPVARAAYDRRRRVDGSASASASASPPAARPPRRTAPATMLQRLCGPLATLIGLGAARRDDAGVITLVLRADEAAVGGNASISIPVDLRCPDCVGADCPRCGGAGTVRELFSAWLAISPEIADGELLAPTVELPGMLAPVRFRVRVRGARP